MIKHQKPVMILEKIEKLLKHDLPGGDEISEKLTGLVDNPFKTDSVELKRASYKRMWFVMIFLDSTYLIGVILKKDTYTDKALKLKPLLKHKKKIINNIVFNEVLNSLTNVNSEYNVDTLINLLLSYEIDFLTSKDYEDVVKLFKHYNYSVNFSDCTILKTMIDNKVDTIISFDSDFDKIKGIHRIYI